MGGDGRYRIVDEPSPGLLDRFAVTPIAPFLCFMVFPLIGVPFFIFNSLALKGRQWIWELFMLAVASVLRFGIPLSVAQFLVLQGVPVASLKYLAIVPLAISLWLAYRVFMLQFITHQIRNYFSETLERA